MDPVTTDPVDILVRLVSIASVNPMGRDIPPDDPIYYEHALTDFLEERLSRWDLTCTRQTVAPRRDNLFARLDGDVPPEQGGALIVLEVHQDTVPADGMTVAPWDPVVRDGRVYGRGACDVKGGMACMLAALEGLVRNRPPDMPTVVLACSVNEEYGFTGARAMARSWSEGTCPMVPRLPDAVVVAEPTSLNVVVAHKGVVRWRIRTSGRATHSSCPQNGENAIYRMGRVLVALEQYAAELSSSAADPKLGPPTLSVGTINGGISVNTVPDACRIEVDRRLLPDEDPEDARRNLSLWLERHLPESCRPVHDPPLLAAPGLADQSDTEPAQKLLRTIDQHGRSARLIGVPYGTDAPAFAELGIPTVVFGPGSVRQAHTKDEWVAVDQLAAAATVYESLIRGWSVSAG